MNRCLKLSIGGAVARAAVWAILLVLAFPFWTAAQEVFIHEEFKNMDSWESLKFPKIDRLTQYSTVRLDEKDVLKIVSNNSASGLVLQKKYNLAEHPLIEWRWKIDNVLAKGDASKKEGDDYAVRLYVLFAYEPSAVGFFKKAKYEAAKALYGEYPPLASLNYIWANRAHAQKIMTNPFSSETKMIIVDSGPAHIGQWRTHRTDIMADYKAAFGEAPVHPTVSLAVMGDSDNTGGSTTAYIDYIKVFGRDARKKAP